MLVTLCLITTNTYLGVDAPPKRGFSYVEIWLCGCQVPMLLGITVYSYILSARKFDPPKSLKSNRVKSLSTTSKNQFLQDDINLADTKKMEDKLHDHFRRIDKTFGVVSMSFFIVFCIVYWATGLSVAS